MRSWTIAAVLGFALALWGVSGCQKSGTDSGAGSSEQKQQQESGSSTSTGGEAEGLAALSPEDRALAEKQGTCPVSGEPLGEMGTPVKVEVDGKVVFLCCDHCRGKFDENPQEYLAKIEASSQPEGEAK